MIEPSGLKIGTIGPVEKPKQPQVDPESDPVVKAQVTHKKRRNGYKRS